QVGRLGGLVAGLLAPVGFMWLDKATSAEIDTLQVAWVTASVLFLLRALEETDKETRRPGDKEPEILALRVLVGANSVKHLNATATPPVSRSPRLPVSLSPGLSGRWWLAALLCVAGGFLTTWTA